MGIQEFPKQEGIYTKLSKTNLSISIHLSICAGVPKIHLGDENMISASCLGEKQKTTGMCISKYGILIAMPLVGEIPKPRTIENVIPKWDCILPCGPRQGQAIAKALAASRPVISPTGP